VCIFSLLFVGTLSAQSGTGCDTVNGTQFNLEPRLNAIPQNTESVDFLLNRVSPGVDLVVGAANDERRQTVGGFDAYYVHRTGTTCGVDFEGTLSTASIRPSVVADPARDAFFFADQILSVSPAVEIARTTAATLLSTTACPNGTNLNGTNPNCWPLFGLANYSNPNAQQALLGHHIAVDPRTSGTGAGDVYVAASVEDTSNFPAVASIQVVVCVNLTLTCGSPVVISGTDKFANRPYVQVRADGVITISYWTFTKSFGTEPNSIDIKFVTCQPQGAPQAPLCSKPTLVATSGVVGSFAPGDSAFRDFLFPKHVNRPEANGTTFTTFLVYDRCRSVIGPAVTLAPVCSKIDLVLTESTNNGATWSTPEPVETASGHQFFGTIRLDQSTGTTNIAYYSTQNDPFLQRARVFLSQIAPGSTTVERATALTTSSTDPDAGIQDFTEPQAEEVVDFGDRIGLAAAGTGTTGQSRVYVHYTWNNVFGISNGTKQPDPNNTLVPFSY
jgi:hypothetical protein